MINVRNIDNLLNAADFSFALTQISEKQKGVLGHYRSIHYVIYDRSDTLFSILLKDLMAAVLKKHKIYLIYLESGPQPMTKLRSYRKMFGVEHRQYIKLRNIAEYEYPMDSTYSLKTAIVKMTNENYEYCLKNLLNSHFAFGYIVPVGERSFKKNRQMFLHDVVSVILEKYKIIRVNIPKLITSYLGPNHKVFTKIISGRDEEIIRFYCEKSQQDDFFSMLNAAVLKHRYMEN